MLHLCNHGRENLMDFQSLIWNLLIMHGMVCIWWKFLKVRKLDIVADSELNKIFSSTTCNLKKNVCVYVCACVRAC